MISIAIVDDNYRMLEVLKHDLTESGKIEVSFTAGDGIEFLKKVEQTDKLPAIVLMDVEMPKMDGIAAMHSALERYPELRFVMLSVIDDEETLYEAIKAGAHGYLLKEETTEGIIQKIEDVAGNGAVPFSPKMAVKVLDLAKSSAPPVHEETEEPELTDREIEILELLADGLTSNDIADELFISFHTVRKHIRNIYSKLQVSTQAQAVKQGFLRRFLGF